MSAAAEPGTSPVAPRRELPGVRVTQLRVIGSEWTKLRSLRSTRWSLLAAFVAMAGLGPLVAAISMARWSHMSLADRLTFNPINIGLGGYNLAQLAIGVLGVLVISGEYTTGMIRSSIMAVPKRLPVLWGKMVVFAAVSFLLMLVAALIGFLASQAILTQHHVNVSLGDTPALRTLIGVVLFMTVTGVLCTAIGTMVRSTAGGITTYVVVMFVLPGVTEILPNSINNAIHPYLPSAAGGAIAQAVPDPHTLSVWGGFALFCGYTVATILAAAVLLRRRDA